MIQIFYRDNRDWNDIIHIIKDSFKNFVTTRMLFSVTTFLLVIYQSTLDYMT